MIRFGPAGWSYADWNGVVYPAPRPRGFHPLAYLAGFFDTVEVNSTFYRPATATAARSWLAAVADRPDFRFTAKLHGRFTHERAAAWGAAEVRAVRDGMDPLWEAGRLGALLLQFPWSFRRTDANREWLSDVASTFAHYPLALEVRHESWNVPGFFRGLAERGIGFVNIDQPLFGDSIAPSAHATGRVGYVRVHGRNYQDWWRPDAGVYARYDYLYPAAELEPWAARIAEVAAQPEAEDVYVVTNNHARGQAVANALMVQSMVTGQPVHAPAGVLRHYAAELAPYAKAAER